MGRGQLIRQCVCVCSSLHSLYYTRNVFLAIRTWCACVLEWELEFEGVAIGFHGVRLPRVECALFGPTPTREGLVQSFSSDSCDRGLCRPASHQGDSSLSEQMYSRDRLSSNTNSNNNVSMTRHQTRCKPLLPSKQKDHLQRKSSTEDTRSVRKDPPPPYHYSILGHPYPSTIAPNLQPNGSGFVDSAARPSRERRREGRARERVGGQWSPRTLPRSQSLERFRSSIRDPLHTSPEQLSYGHSQYQSVGGREKSQPTECARAPSPTPSRRQQYSSSEMVRQSMERNKSPALRRSHSFSHHHSKPSREYHDNQSTQQHYSSSLYKDITKLTSPRLPRHDHTLSDWSHTPSPPSFPCSVSSSNPSLQQTHTRPSKAPPPLASSDYSTASQTSRVAPHSFYSSPSPTSHSSSPTGSGGSSRTPVKLPPSPALRHSPRSETTSSLSTLSSLPSSHISVADSGHRQPRNNPTTSTTPTTTSSPSPSAKVVDKKGEWNISKCRCIET